METCGDFNIISFGPFNFSMAHKLIQIWFIENEL